MKSKKIPVIVIAVLLFLIIGALIINERNQANNIINEDYAYKELTGRHSPYLMDLNNPKYIVDYELDTGYDYGDGIKAYDDMGNPLTEFETNLLNRVETTSSEVYEHGNGAFKFLLLTDAMWDTEEQLSKFKEDVYIQESLKALEVGIDRLIKGTFEWDYRQESNKADFLGFRVAEKEFDGNMTSVDVVYSRIMSKLLSGKIKSTVEYNKEEVRMYINPLVGGFVVECPITLTIMENGIESVYKFEYIPILSFITPNERDVWKLWASSDEGVQMVEQDYIRNIEKIK